MKKYIKKIIDKIKKLSVKPKGLVAMNSIQNPDNYQLYYTYQKENFNYNKQIYELKNSDIKIDGLPLFFLSEKEV